MKDARPFPRVVEWSFTHLASGAASDIFATYANDEIELSQEIVCRAVVAEDYDNAKLFRIMNGGPDLESTEWGIGRIAISVVREDAPGVFSAHELTAQLSLRATLDAGDPLPQTVTPHYAASIAARIAARSTLRRVSFAHDEPCQTHR